MRIGGISLTNLEKVKLAVKTLDSKKAVDIRVLKIGDISILADYFIIAGATSTTQVKALSDEVEFQLKQAGVEPLHTEGYRSANWVILDYGDVVIHTFHNETRAFYSLEKLWSDGQELPAADFLQD